MPQDHVNLVKLCVGAERVEDLEAWQAARIAENPAQQPRHVTRMWPRRAEELLAGGSLYWVFRGQILARQRILALDEVIGDDGIRRCGLRLGRQIIRTHAAPRRPFQGWRYLPPEAAPPDLARAGGEGEPVPAELAARLSEIGIL